MVGCLLWILTELVRDITEVVRKGKCGRWMECRKRAASLLEMHALPCTVVRSIMVWLVQGRIADMELGDAETEIWRAGLLVCGAAVGGELAGEGTASAILLAVSPITNKVRNTGWQLRMRW